MDNMIVINNLNFRYNNKVVFNNFNLSIKKGSFTTVIGSNGSGKSTLVKLLTGLVSSNNIYIDDVLVCRENLSSIRKHIGVVMSDCCDSFICDSVMDELSCVFPDRFDRSYVYEICSLLGISSLLDKNPMELSYSEKQLVNFSCALINKPDLIILDDAFSMIDGIVKIKLFEFLNRLNIDFGVTILNITSDIEESLYGDLIAVIDKGHVILYDNKVAVYKREKVLNKVGFKLPFMVDLSKRLSYYDLVDDFIFDMDEMVDLLWK